MPLGANARITQRESTRGEYTIRSGALDTHWYRPCAVPDSTAFSLTGFASDFNQMSNQADTEALVKLRNQKAELGVSLLEARKSLNHLASVATRLLTVVRDLRKGRFSAVADVLGLNISRRATKSLAKNWLEYSYAWRPLIWDVSAAYNIAQEGLKVPLTMRVERNVKRSLNGTLPIWVDYVRSDGLGGQQSSTVTVPFEGGVKTILYTKISNAELQRLGMLGLINPVEIAWELVPWSFVVDWFVPVGTLLSACTATFGQTFVSGTRTKWLQVDHSFETGEGNYQGFRLDLARKRCRAKIAVFEYQRTALTSFPMPAVYGRQSLSTSKVITAAALWRSLRR